MQVSIYLNPTLVRKIDGLARKKKESRSQLIQSLLNEMVRNKKTTSVFDEVFGVIKSDQADNLLDSIYKSRKNSSRFR